MPYRYPAASTLPGKTSVDAEECVALIRRYAGAPCEHVETRRSSVGQQEVGVRYCHCDLCPRTVAGQTYRQSCGLLYWTGQYWCMDRGPVESRQRQGAHPAAQDRAIAGAGKQYLPEPFRQCAGVFGDRMRPRRTFAAALLLALSLTGRAQASSAAPISCPAVLKPGSIRVDAGPGWDSFVEFPLTCMRRACPADRRRAWQSCAASSSIAASAW